MKLINHTNEIPKQISAPFSTSIFLSKITQIESNLFICGGGGFNRNLKKKVSYSSLFLFHFV